MNKTNFSSFMVLALLLTGLAYGAPPVATVSSTGTFALRGATVKADGVPSWPMMAGDEISTTTAVAVIQFLDGSRVTLEGGSMARVDKTASGMSIRLSSGSMQVLARSGALKVFNSAGAVSVVPGTATSVAVSATARGAAAMTGATQTTRTRPPPISAH